MRNKKLINTRVIQVVSILAALTFVQPVLATCIQSTPDAAELVFTIDANNGCESINNHFGCNIKKVASGSCKYGDEEDGGFTAHSRLNEDGTLGWYITQLNDEKLVKIDVAIIGGAIKGNNCGYGFEFDVESGSGGDCKGTIDAFGNCEGTIQNITSLDVCTDLIDEAPPPEPEVPPVAATLKSCQTVEQFQNSENGSLDETGIRCPVYTQADIDALLPGENPTFTLDAQKPVVVCNFEKDKYAWGTTGANEEGSQEEVCCQCGINMDEAKACFVSDDSEENDDNGCARTLTSDPTEDVTVTLQKDGVDPCTKIVSGGRVYKVCW